MASKDLSAIDQGTLPLARRARRVEVPIELVNRQPNFLASIILCVQLSGLQQDEVYLSLEIDAGHWTRMMKGDAHFPTNKLNDLMALCGNIAPLLWLANSNGRGVVLLKSEAERRAEEQERRAIAAEEKVLMLTELIKGK